MKIFAVLMLGLGLAVTARAEMASPTKPGAKAPAGKDAKDEEPPPTIPGITIPRGERGFMGIQVVDSVFRLTFYNAKKKPIPPDVSRAALRWDTKYRIPEEHTVLTPGGDENSLTSGKPIRPPLVFKLFITLITDVPGGEPIAETFPVDFHQ